MRNLLKMKSSFCIFILISTSVVCRSIPAKERSLSNKTEQVINDTAKQHSNNLNNFAPEPQPELDKSRELPNNSALAPKLNLNSSQINSPVKDSQPNNIAPLPQNVSDDKGNSLHGAKNSSIYPVGVSQAPPPLEKSSSPGIESKHVEADNHQNTPILDRKDKKETFSVGNKSNLIPKVVPESKKVNDDIKSKKNETHDKKYQERKKLEEILNSDNSEEEKNFFQEEMNFTPTYTKIIEDNPIYENEQANIIGENSQLKVKDVIAPERKFFPKQGLYDDANSHFFAYFLTLMVMAVLFYLLFHNKQRIIALLIEGRRGRPSRRGSARAKYHKLDNNLEEAMSSTRGGSGANGTMGKIY